MAQHVLDCSWHRDTISSIIGSQNLQYSLLYCSKQHGWLPADELLHLISHKGPTVVVFQAHHKKKTIGGYLSQPWTTVDAPIADPNAKAFILEDRTCARRGLMVLPAASNYKEGHTASYSTVFGPCFGTAGNLRFMEGGRSCLHSHNLHTSFINNDPDGDQAVTAGFQCCSKQNWMQIWQVMPQVPQPSWRLGSSLSFELQDADAQLLELTQFRMPGRLAWANILLLGPVSSGKSSLVTTVDSVIKGHLTRRAECGLAPDGPLTKCLRRYNFASGSCNIPLVLWDTAGWREQLPGAGSVSVVMEDSSKHEKKATNVPLGTLLDRFQDNPMAMEQFHTAVVCLDSSVEHGPKTIARVRSIRECCEDRGLKVLVVLTKVDQLDDELATSLDQVFQSVLLQKLVTKLSLEIGLPPNHFFPIKNMSSEYNLADNPAVAALVVQLVQHVLLCSAAHAEASYDSAQDKEDEEQLSLRSNSVIAVMS